VKKYGFVIIHYCALIISMMLLISCRDIFQFSPHQTDIDPALTNETHKNIVRLTQYDPGIATRFSFAIISDTHCYYKDFDEAVTHINGDTEIQFTIHAGDMTDLGLKQQYEIACSIMQRFKKPYFTVIGNHDCLSNGQEIYTKMFGDFYYAFSFADTIFFMFHDNIWELDNIPPDVEELDRLLTEFDSFNHMILVGHIPPFGDQFDYPIEKAYRDVLEKHSVTLSAHGHVHQFMYDPDYYNDNIPYLTVDTIANRHYAKITIDGDSLIVENVRF